MLEKNVFAERGLTESEKEIEREERGAERHKNRVTHGMVTWGEEREREGEREQEGERERGQEMRKGGWGEKTC